MIASCKRGLIELEPNSVVAGGLPNGDTAAGAIIAFSGCAVSVNREGKIVKIEVGLPQKSV